MDSQIQLIGVYDFNDNALLVEMLIDECHNDILFDGFNVPDNSIDESNWQVPYMEQYLSLDGVEKLCETDCIIREQAKPS